MKNYDLAIKDCNTVLSADCMNLKALLRRALALDHQEKKSEVICTLISIYIFIHFSKLFLRMIKQKFFQIFTNKNEKNF